MMTRLLDDSVEHGEPVSMLTASEATIYERFGYGVSTRAASLVMDRRDVEFVRPRPPGRFRLVDVDEADKVEPDVYDRMRRTYPGALSRPTEWWSQEFEPEMGNRFDVLYESPDGTIDGYATYGIREHWGHGGSEASLSARDVIAATPTALHALWRYLLEVDLVRTVRQHSIPLDTPLPWLISSMRAARFEMVHDYVWTRLLDIPAALGARTYAVPGRLVLDVRDGARPGGPADGRFAIEGASDGATVSVASAATANLSCDIATVSAAWLGGVRWSELAAAGLVDELTPGALLLADAMFMSTPLPYPFTGF
jgi:predicted acetyltransferase